MFKLLLTASVVICDLYLFHIISLLNPNFKLVNNLISSSLDKVTAGTYNLQSFIASVAPVGALLLPIILFLYLNVFELTTLILSKLLSSASSLNSSL